MEVLQLHIMGFDLSCEDFVTGWALLVRGASKYGLGQKILGVVSLSGPTCINIYVPKSYL